MHAPDFELTAVSSQRRYRLSKQRGMPVLLAFVGYQTASQLEGVIKPIRLRFRDTTMLSVAAVVDVSAVPRLMTGVVRGIMDAAFAEAAKQIPAGYEPADFLILLPDWEGKVLQGFEMTAVNQRIGLVGIDAAGEIVQRYQGDAPAIAAIEMVEGLLRGG